MTRQLEQRPRDEDVFRIQCPSCKVGYRLRASAAPAFPVSVNCKKCGHRITIEDPAHAGGPGRKTLSAPSGAADNSEAVSRTGLERSPLPAALVEAKGANNNLLSFYIGRNAAYYLDRFIFFTLPGKPVFTATWHWPAFLIAPLWFLYRKLYLWALLAFVLGLIPLVNLACKVVWGVCANYIYYRHVNRGIEQIKQRCASTPGEDLGRVLRKKGGVNQWVPFAVAVIPIVGILSAIAIPQFLSYRNRLYDARARAAVEQVVAAQQACYAKNHFYADSLELLQPFLKKGNIATQIQVAIHNADTEDYLVEGHHPKGRFRYTATSISSSVIALPMESRDLFGPRKWCKITVPDDWRRMKDLNAQADIQAGQAQKDSYVIVFVEDKTDFFGVDLESYAELTRTGIEDYLLTPETQMTAVNQINGHKVIQYQISGSMPDTRVRVVYLHTLVQGRRGFYQILTWTSESHYEANQEMLKSIVRRFTEL